MRNAEILRTTKETDIKVIVDLDGTGKCECDSTIGFFDHMISAFARFSCIDICIIASGDLEVDQHHLIEDIGLAIGKAIDKALGSKEAIGRAGYFIFPMDESLTLVGLELISKDIDELGILALDIGGRPYLRYEAEFKRRFCGSLDTDTLEDFFYGISVGMNANIVIRVPYGRSDHHKIESIFKGFGKAMRSAIAKDNGKEIPSTKGIIGE